MKVERHRKSDYSKFERKLYWKLVGILVLGFAGILLLRELLRGRVGDLIVDFLIHTFYLSVPDAHTIYQFTIRNHMELILAAVSLIVVLVGFRVVVHRMTRYFTEISRGLDSVLAEGKEPPSLSPELCVMEEKLEQCGQLLEVRERKAKEAEEKKNDLVMYLAHDMRTPLTSVIGYLELLEEVPEMPEAQRSRYLRVALEKAGRLETLMNEFFDITRFNQQTILLERQSFSLTYMLRQMIEEFYPMLGDKNQKICLEQSRELYAEGDPDKLARVFNNLLKNAIAYGDRDSEIRINVEETGKELQITIENQGRQIPPQKLELLFEKFYRLDDSRASDTGNAGLGLAIAREIVELHGGSVQAESREHAVAFIVKLPKNGEVQKKTQSS